MERWRAQAPNVAATVAVAGRGDAGQRQQSQGEGQEAGWEEGGRGDGREAEQEGESHFNTEAPAIRQGGCICIREGHSSHSKSPLLSTLLVNG
ncbi:hypothetical protein CesoFtcFv8_011258 [Champsocephalus esox]|uniref:Uncharacterized protein n=1 Tax=Champsocephalus esox TaxID=159716 RepID=A0AAN8GX07_9TELE|nr:hypothetical protein CesoFtcFv8_011258 [Champsocephalus esox]